MAGLIAHIFCALALIQSNAIKITDEQSFLIGTCYPDIRYLGTIKRETTHYQNVRWEDVLNAPSDFQKGILVHALVDEVRISILERNAKPYLPALPVMRSQLMKFFEDSLLYHKIHDWPKILRYFDTLITEEKIHSLSDKTLLEWHRFITTYCIQQPSILSIHCLINQFPPLKAQIPLSVISIFSKAYVAIAFRSFNKQPLLNIIDHFYTHCVDLITHNAHLTAWQPSYV